MTLFEQWLDEEITIGYDDLKVKRRETLNRAEYQIAKEAFEAGLDAGLEAVYDSALSRPYKAPLA